MLPLLGNRRVLDLGCGRGVYLQHFAPDSVGLELSADALAECRRRVLDARMADLCHPLPVEVGEFDAAFCSNVLEHIPSPLGLLREARRAVRHPGGMVVLALPLEGSVSDLGGRNRYWAHHPGHLYSFSPRCVHRLLAASGFVARSHFVEPWPAEKLERLGLLGLADAVLRRVPLSLARRLGDNYWTVAATTDLPGASSRSACDRERLSATARVVPAGVERAPAAEVS